MKSKSGQETNKPNYLSLVLLFLFAPRKFIDQEKKYNNLSGTAFDPLPSSVKLRKALTRSLMLISITAIFAVLSAFFLNAINLTSNERLISISQIGGALILLWATLAVRGWDIQTYAGNTPTEKINQFIFRSLYCFGTYLFILSMTWK